MPRDHLGPPSKLRRSFRKIHSAYCTPARARLPVEELQKLLNIEVNGLSKTVFPQFALPVIITFLCFPLPRIKRFFTVSRNTFSGTPSFARISLAQIFHWPSLLCTDSNYDDGLNSSQWFHIHCTKNPLRIATVDCDLASALGGNALQTLSLCGNAIQRVGRGTICAGLAVSRHGVDIGKQADLSQEFCPRL